MLLNQEIDDQHVRNRIYQEIIPKEELEQKVEQCELLARPADYNCWDFVEARYSRCYRETKPSAIIRVNSRLAF